MSKDAGWYLDGYVDGERMARRIPITALPFRIGRGEGLEARLPAHHVSVLHAEIFSREGSLWLRDHKSSNGTFRNRERVTGDVRLDEGDIIHISTNEFVLRREAYVEENLEGTMCFTSEFMALPANFVSGTGEIRGLIDGGFVTPHFQPLVPLDDLSQITGFELLGRGNHPDLPVLPSVLFEIAATLGLECELSQLFRRRGLEVAQSLPGSPALFVNSHPAEMGEPALVESLRELRTELPELRITLETHEAAVQSPASMRELRAALTDLDIGLAYDDFGAGQARLVELVEVPPDVLKFDISLVQGIDLGPDSRRTMLRTLVAMVNDMGITCLAEGIETPGELAVCRDLGFRYGQGYLLGRPAEIEIWLQGAPSTAGDSRVA